MKSKFIIFILGLGILNSSELCALNSNKIIMYGGVLSGIVAYSYGSYCLGTVMAITVFPSPGNLYTQEVIDEINEDPGPFKSYRDSLMWVTAGIILTKLSYDRT